MLGSLARNTLLYLPAQLLGPMFQFAVTVIWTHLLGPAGFGVVTFVVAAQEITGLAGLSWWSIFVVRFQQRFVGPDGMRFRAMDSRMVAFGSLCQIVLAAPTLLLIGASPNLPLVSATAAYLATRTALAHYSEWARSDHRIGVYTLAQFAAPVMGSGLSVVAALLLGADPAIALAAMAIGQAIGLALVLTRLRAWPRFGRLDRDVLADALRYGLPLVVSGGFAWAGANGIRVLVEMHDGIAGVGIFSAGWGLGQRLAVVFAMLCTAAAFPLAVERLESGDQAGALRQVSTNGVLMIGLLAPALAGIAFLSKPMVRLLIATQFQDATILILPLAMATSAVRMIRTHTADQTGLLLERTATMTAFNFLDALLALAGGGTGVYFGGVTGAAIGCLIGTCLGSVAPIAFSIAWLGLPVPIGALVKILLATAIMCAPLWAAPAPATLVSMALHILLGASVYGLAILALFPEVRRALPTARLGAR